MLIWAGVFVQCDSYCTNKSLKIAFGPTFFCVWHFGLVDGVESRLFSHVSNCRLKWHRLVEFSHWSLPPITEHSRNFEFFFLNCDMDEYVSWVWVALTLIYLADRKIDTTNQLSTVGTEVDVAVLVANSLTLQFLLSSLCLLSSNMKLWEAKVVNLCNV